MKAPAALESVIAESHEALRKILNRDPSGYAALFANPKDIADPITTSRPAESMLGK
jgi:hypothetical protein